MVIIDRKALTKTVQLWKFISRVYDQVWISDNHSKILLVDFPDGKGVSMVTSQNLTRGNRAESAVISTERKVFDKLYADFEDLRNNMSIPMHELMPLNCGDREISADMCEEIERLAGYFVPLSDIATVLELNPVELRERIADAGSPESRAYARGKAKAKIKLKAQEMELASVGSPLAMQSVRENLVLMEEDE